MVSANRWSMLALLWFTRVSMGFQFQSLASVGPLMVQELGISYAQLGLLMGLYMLPGVFIAIPGAFLGAWLGDRRAVMTGLLLMIAGGILLGFSEVYWVAVMGRLISGAGAVTLNVQVTKMVTDWFAGREIATGMSILLVSWPLGIALALALGGVAGDWYGWQGPVWLTTGYAVVGLAAFSTMYQDPPSISEIQVSLRDRLVLPLREILLASGAGWVWMTYNGGFILLPSFAPVFMAERGASLVEAGAISSIIMWLAAGSIPLGGMLADRLRFRHGMIVVGGIATALVCWAMPLWPWVTLGFVLAGITMGPPAGPIMSLPSEALPPQRRGMGLGIYFTWYYMGMAFFPALGGMAQDATGSAAWPIGIAGGFMALTSVALAIFLLLHRRLRR